MTTWNSESRMLKHLTCLGVCACGSSQQMRHVKLSFDLERQLELSWITSLHLLVVLTLRFALFSTEFEMCLQVATDFV